MNARRDVSAESLIGGFTLIELLVVVAIIGILASLILPALAGAKSRARTANCISNMRQFAIACQLYAQDNQDKLLPNKDGMGASLGETWVEGWLGLPGPDCTNINYLKESLIYTYVSNPKVWSCPVNREPNVFGITQPRVRTVSLNCFIGAPWRRDNVETYSRLSQISKPAQVITFVDEWVETVNDGSFGQQLDFDPKTPGGWVLRDKPGRDHGKGGNFAFADGHAETHRWKDARTLSAPRDDALMPGNVDVLWLQEHSTTHTP